MLTISPQGPFSLAETNRFAYIDRDPEGNGPTLRLGFCADHTWEPTAVTVSQDGGDVTVDGPETSRAQVKRILGLDIDATGFADVGTRDPVIGRLQNEAPGMRPPLIHSAYEAAIFCILAARRSGAQARRTRARLAQDAGTILEAEGQTVTCLPAPSYMLKPGAVPGLDDTRRERLAAVAQAALDGHLDTRQLAALDPEEARRRLELLPGIGPFSSAVITVRSLGHTDYLAGPITELNSLVGDLYGLGGPASAQELDRIAAAWAPWRTWSQLYIRSVSGRIKASVQP